MNTERKLYQWDTGQQLTGCTGLYVDFPIGDEVYRVKTADGTCIIPDELLQTSGGHKVYECMTNNTIRSFAFSVTPRPKPPDYVYTPTERLTFEGLVQKVDDAVADMIRRAESGEFDGHTPVKGTDYFTTEEIQQIQNEVSSGAIGEFKSVVDTETNEFNTNATEKLTEYNDNVTEKLNAYNSNATAKLNAYNTNANNSVAEFDSHTEQIQTDISELKSDLADLTNAEIIQPTIFENTGCSGRGIYKQNNQTSKMFNVEKGAKYFIATNKRINGGFSKTQYTSEYEESGLALTNISPVNRTYYNATADGYLYVSATNVNVTCYKIDTTIDEVKNDVMELKATDNFHFLDKFELVWEQGKFINSSNGEALSDSKYYYATKPYEVFGGCNLIVFTRSTNDYSGLAFYDKDNNYISGQKTYDVEWKEWKVPIPRNAKYVRLTAYTYNPVVDISVAYARYENVHEDIYSIYKKTSELEDKTKNVLTYDCFPFERIGVVGDSLASGCSNYYNESGQLKGIDIPKYSWGKFLSRTYGISVDLYSQGGANTRTWLSSDFGLQRLQVSEPCEMYYIGLGNNDYFSLGESYLGTISDVTVGNESSNADTYYGNYSRIIAELKSKSPRCKIFCFTEPNIGNKELCHQYNLAIKEVASLYDNVFVLDLENDTFYSSKPISDTRVGSHYTPTGYKMMSEYIYKITCEFIISHIEDFIDTQWIIQNHN